MPPPYDPLVFTRYPVDAPFTVSTNFGDSITVDGATYQHRGMDLAVPVGRDVYACHRGQGKIVNVFADGDSSGFGNAPVIDVLGTEWYYVLGHMSRVDVRVGDLVTAGDKLGLSGNTGKSTGPHVHWQPCKSANFPVDITQSADPMSFLNLSAPPAGKSYSSEEIIGMLMRVAGGGWGFTADDGRELKGIDALVYLDQKQRSMPKGLVLTQIAVAGADARQDAAIAELRGLIAPKGDKS
jgi:hypothetical protein